MYTLFLIHRTMTIKMAEIRIILEFLATVLFFSLLLLYLFLEEYDIFFRLCYESITNSKVLQYICKNSPISNPISRFLIQYDLWIY